MKLKLYIKHYFIGYFFLLLLLYHYKIKTYFYWNYIASLNDTFFDFSLDRCLIAIFIFSINLYWLTKGNSKQLSFLVLSLFFALLTIPSLIAFTSANMYPIKLLLYHQVLFWALLLFTKIRLNFNNVPVFNKKQALYLLLGILIIGTIPYLLVYGPHINLKNLLLIDVYETRTKMGALSNAYFGYTYSVFTKIIIPLIILFSLELKNKILLLLGVFYLVLFYLFGAHKSVYGGLIVVFAFYKWSYAQSVKIIIKYSNVFIVLFLMLSVVNIDYPWILTFRRIHFLPSLLDISYLDFFEEKPLFWSGSILKRFIEYPYDVPHVNLIGAAYFNRPSMAANNGLISEGYMNAGTWGVLFNSFLVATYFAVLNSLRIPSKYMGLFVLVIFSFISSSVFTVFLTHGAIALLIISVFLLKKKI